MKGKEKVSERMLNEIQASQLSDIEFKALVIRKLNELTEKSQKLQRKYSELTTNYINMKKKTEIINKGQEEMNNIISELKNTVEEIKSRLDEALDQRAGGQGRKKPNHNEQEKEKRLTKNEEGLREMQDNMKQNNIHVES